MVDLEALTNAWRAARKTLDALNEELRVVKAGQETALRCEREAWAAMANCRDKDEVAAVPAAEQPKIDMGQASQNYAAQVVSTRQIQPPFISYMTNVAGLSRTGW
jgi:hypothetical protein